MNMDAVSVMIIFLKLSISVTGRKILLTAPDENVDGDEDEEEEKMENWLQSISDTPNMKVFDKKAGFDLGASKNVEITSFADFPMQLSTHDVQIPNGNLKEERLYSLPKDNSANHYHNVDLFTTEEKNTLKDTLKGHKDRDEIIKEIINNSFRPDDTTGLHYGDKTLFYPD